MLRLLSLTPILALLLLASPEAAANALTSGEPPPDEIFSDGFESGDTSAWSSTVPFASSLSPPAEISVTECAALEGTTFGLRLSTGSGGNAYVQDDSPAGERVYRARFYLDPNGIGFGSTESHPVFRMMDQGGYGLTGPGGAVAQLVIGKDGTGYWLRTEHWDDHGGKTSSANMPIPDAPVQAEIEFAAATSPGANDGLVQVYVDGALVYSAVAIDNDISKVDLVRLGQVDRGSINASPPGASYIDEFESFRSLVPPAGTDIDIEYISSTASPQRGDTVFIRARATNNGSETVQTRIYFDVMDPLWDVRRYSVLSKPFPAGTSVQIQKLKQIKFPLAEDAIEGPYTVFLVAAADIASGGEVYDSDSFSFNLGPLAPDPTKTGAPEAGPNPFTRETVIRYAVERDAEVDLRVFDARGREVAQLASGVQSAGEHRAVFAAGELPGGVYVWRLSVAGEVTTGRVALVR